MAEVNKDLLKILACPVCKSSVRQAADGLHCLNSQCGRIYPVRDDIPIMLVNEARQAKPHET